MIIVPKYVPMPSAGHLNETQRIPAVQVDGSRINAIWRGQGPNLPVATDINNRLLVQFHILRTGADCAWGKLEEEFMLKM